MKALVVRLFVVTCLVSVSGVYAGDLSAKPAPDRYTSRCQSQEPYRIGGNEQGTALWGSKQSWKPHAPDDQMTNVLESVYLDRLLLTIPGTPAGVHALRLEDGRLVASAEAGGASGEASMAGLVLQARSSSGPTEVAICSTEPADETGKVWFRLEAWNPVAQAWENPCVASAKVPNPRALPVGGVWDATGAHHDPADQFTFACENGAIAKCIQWGYRPWESRDGRSLANLHQACTRMARADYCGDGHSHTKTGNIIDIYDTFGIIKPEPENADGPSAVISSFEAFWGPDGATCINQTRLGDPVETILRECPGRFQVGTRIDLGGGDQCGVWRAGASASVGLVRNRLARRVLSRAGANGAAAR